MEMRREYIHTDDGRAIAVAVAEHEGKTLLECGEATAFLRHLLGDPAVPDLAPGTYVRGVISPGDGALLELFDSIGAQSRDPIRIDDDVTRERLAELC